MLDFNIIKLYIISKSNLLGLIALKIIIIV